MDDKKKSDIKDSELESLTIDTPVTDESNLNPDAVTSDNAAPPPSRKKHTERTILIIIAIILVLVGSGVASYFAFFQPAPQDDTAKAPATSTADTKEEVKAETDYAADIIAKIRAAEEALATTYPNSKVEVQDDNSPGFKYRNDPYYVSGNFGKGLIVTDTSNTDPNSGFLTATRLAATTVLDAEKDLTKTASEYTAIYTGKNVLCTVSTDGYPAYIACANTIEYKAISEAVAPFAAAYFKSVGTEYQTKTGFRAPVINKKSQGYANAVMSIGPYEGVGGFAGLFYSKDGTNWTFWKGTQSQLDCNDYNTVDIQKAFEGDSCYDEKNPDTGIVVVKGIN